jgi:hypothetical protein
MKRNSEIDSPTRMASDHTMRWLLPLSVIMKYSAEPRLAMMRMNAMATNMCMKTASWPKKFDPSIIAPQLMCRVGVEGFTVGNAA